MCGVGGQMMPPAGVGAGPQMHASGIHISPANPFAQVGESLHVSIINLPRSMRCDPYVCQYNVTREKGFIWTASHGTC